MVKKTRVGEVLARFTLKRDGRKYELVRQKDSAGCEGCVFDHKSPDCLATPCLRPNSNVRLVGDEES